MFANNNIPFASVVTENDQQDVPFAVPVIDLDILRSRMAFHLDVAIDIVIAMDEQAKRKEVRACLLDACGWMFDSKTAKKYAIRELEEAQELRKQGVKAGVIYLAVALSVTTVVFVCEHGLFRKPYEAVKSSVSGISESVGAAFNWLKNAVVVVTTTLKGMIFGEARNISLTSKEEFTRDLASKTNAINIESKSAEGLPQDQVIKKQFKPIAREQILYIYANSPDTNREIDIDTSYLDLESKVLRVAL